MLLNPQAKRPTAKNKKYLYIVILCLLLLARKAPAQEFTSSSFKIIDPALFSGGYSTSSSYGLNSVVSQLSIGTSTISGSYELRGGFLYFPYVSTPVVTATAGDGQVALSWTSADASQGWAVSGYSVGQSTTSGGPYTYTNLGNVLSSTRTGLSNGTTYYFILRVIDGVSDFIATSSEVSAVPASSGGGGGGGGGGSSGSSYQTGGVNFTGRAYPRSTVTLLKDAQVLTTTVADANADFKINVANLTAGNYFFSLYSEDNKGNRSSLLTFPVSVTAGITTNIGSIFVAPTIAVDKSEVKKGDNITIFGQTVKEGEVTIQVNSEQEFFVKTKTDATGTYLYNFDTAALEYGDHSAKSKTTKGGEISSFSPAVGFLVGDKNIFTQIAKGCNVKSDVNKDCKVNLVDFSIVAYWYKRSSPPTRVDLNSDNRVDLVDFSIMAFNWTG